MKNDKNVKKSVDKKKEKPDIMNNDIIVTFDVRREKFKACKRDPADGKVDFIGFYDTEEDARKACA